MTGHYIPSSHIFGLFHLEMQFSTSQYLLMREAIITQRLPIEGYRLDEIIIHVLAISRKNELPAVFQIQSNLVKAWSTYIIIRCTRTYRIESDRREHIPRRHLSCIIISRQSARRIIILGLENMMHPLLRFSGAPAAS